MTDSPRPSGNALRVVQSREMIRSSRDLIARARTLLGDSRLVIARAKERPNFRLLPQAVSVEELAEFEERAREYLEQRTIEDEVRTTNRLLSYEAKGS